MFSGALRRAGVSAGGRARASRAGRRKKKETAKLMETVLVTTGRDRIIKDAPFKAVTLRVRYDLRLSYVHIRPRNDLESETASPNSPTVHQGIPSLLSGSLLT